MFCFLVPGQETAVVLANVFIGLNNLYSGFVASPATMTRTIFFKILYFVAPGRYVYKGMVTSLFYGDFKRSVTVPQASPYFDELGCVADASGSCTVSVSEFFKVYFDDMWYITVYNDSIFLNSFWENVGVLLVWSISIRIVSSVALKYIKYSGK